MPQWTATSLTDLPSIAKEIIPLMQEKVILFNGEMGAGKTTFIASLIKEMGSQDEVSSPTYALVNEYLTQKGTVFHFDFYRINHEEEAYDIGWEEYAYSNQWCFVEWGEKISSLIPEKNHILEIFNQNGVRVINFK